MKLTKKIINKGSGIYLIEDAEEEAKENTVLRWLSNGHFAIRADVLPVQDRDAVLAGEAAVRARWGACETKAAPPMIRAPSESVKMQLTSWLYQGRRVWERMYRVAQVAAPEGSIHIDNAYEGLLPGEPAAHATEDGALDGQCPLVDDPEDPKIVVMPLKSEA